MEEYDRLFADATEAHLLGGEASVYYLRSSVVRRNSGRFRGGVAAAGAASAREQAKLGLFDDLGHHASEGV
jgi:hypothetical protein